MSGGGAARALLGAALAVAAAASPARGQEERPEIASVEFVGNVAFSDAALARAVVAKASGCPLVLAITSCALGLDWGRRSVRYRPRVLEDDAERLRLLYRAHGFRGVRVRAVAEEGDDGTARIAFRIDEGTPYRVASVRFVGDGLPPGLERDRPFPVAVGDPLSFLLIEAASDTLATQLRNVGYAFAEVFLGYFLAEGSDWATVSYDVDLGPRTRFGPIRVSGNELLDDDVVLSRLPFEEGQLYEDRLIGEAQHSLHELAIVTRTRVLRDSSVAGDSILPIDVEITEGDVHRVRPGGGFNSLDCLNVEGSWLSRNFLGGGRTLQVRARASNLLAGALEGTPLCGQAGIGVFGRVNWVVGVDFAQPTLLSRRADLHAGLFAERESRRDLFVRDALGLELGFVRSLGPRSLLQVRYRPEVDRLEAAEATLCAAFLACAPADVEALSGARRLAPISASFSRDASDDLFNPTRGARAVADLELADRFTGSDYRYVRAFVDGSLYRGIGDRAVLALRARGGRIAERGPGRADAAGRFSLTAPPQKRFYAGGANGVRGFAESALGPRNLTIAVEELLRRAAPGVAPACTPESVFDLSCDGGALAASNLYRVRPVGGLATLEASAELRFRMADGALGGAAFVDVGQAWPEGFDLTDLEVSPGLGLRYNTRFGPVRVDVAYPFREKEPLQVVTSRIRPFRPLEDPASERIDVAPPGGPEERIDWVVAEELALLGPRVRYGDDPGFSLRRFQLHFSIGQAF